MLIKEMYFEYPTEYPPSKNQNATTAQVDTTTASTLAGNPTKICQKGQLNILVLKKLQLTCCFKNIRQKQYQKQDKINERQPHPTNAINGLPSTVKTVRCSLLLAGGVHWRQKYAKRPNRLIEYLSVKEGVHVLNDELAGQHVGGDVAVRQERNVLLRFGFFKI